MKTILVDFGCIMFRAIFNYEMNRKIPATYTALSMLISNLTRVGLDPEDHVIIAVDSPKGSWRKEIDSDYKANRKASREKHDINWPKEFFQFNRLLEKIDSNTPFHVITIDKLEADDIIAYSCKKFKDEKCVVVSTDSDYEQLCALPNVRLFSPVSKRYKEVKNPYLSMAKKIEVERTDNLLSPILSEEDFERRKKIIDLLELPEEVNTKVEEKVSCLYEKDWDLSAFSISLRPRFLKIYEKDKVVSESKKKRKSKRRKNESICNN